MPATLVPGNPKRGRAGQLGLQVEDPSRPAEPAGGTNAPGESLQDYYERVILPQERARLGLAIGEVTGAFGQQAGASKGRNIDLARRLGLGIGASRGFGQIQSTTLRQALANALARRRAQFQEEIQGFRGAELGREVGRRQQSLQDFVNTSSRQAETVGAVGGALASAVLGVVGAGGAGSGVQQGLGQVGSPAREAAQQDIDSMALEQRIGVEGPSFQAPFSAGSVAPSGSVNLAQLGSRLAQGQGGQVLSPEDEEERRRRLLGVV